MSTVSDPQVTLAIDGGRPVRSRPWPAWPHFGPEEIEAAAAVLQSGKVNYWTGDEGRRFEEEYAEALGARYAVALSNGTVALEAALVGLGIGPGDEVIVTCRSFVASAACCLLHGAVPVFADVDPHSQNLTAQTVWPLIGPRTRAILAVHLAGWPCEMDSLMELAARHGLAVIEDCAQAHGARYRGRPAGSLGHVAALSFCQDKILTTGGEGGMLVTNDRQVWSRAWSYKDHGKDWDAARSQKAAGAFRWLHQSVGTNGRMTEMQAAIGRVVLRKLDGWVNRRRHLAALLNRHLSDLPALRQTIPPSHVHHAYYKYYAFLRSEMLQPGWTRDRIIQAISAEGIPCGSGICPEIYREQAFAARPAPTLSVAHRLGCDSLMFQVHPTLSEEEILDTSRAVHKVLAVAAADHASWDPCVEKDGCTEGSLFSSRC